MFFFKWKKKNLFLLQDVSECDKSPVPGFKNPLNKTPLCFVQSNQDGIFTFPSVPASTYKVVSRSFNHSVPNIHWDYSCLADTLGGSECNRDDTVGFYIFSKF